MPFRVAIIGDSAMWGQGLLHEHTFAHLAATEIAASHDEALEVLPGRGTEPERGEARSGAKLKPIPGVSKPVEIPDEPGAVAFRSGDADAFLNLFPTLIRDDNERRRFRDGIDESPAARLYGENPATFPTISDGIRHLAGANGATVRLVILDGGVNDVDFRKVLDPEGPDIRDIDRAIRSAFRDSLAEVLRAARAAFPSAVVVVTGYFSALSDESESDELETLFEFFSGKEEWLIAANDVIQYFPVISDLLNLAGLGKDVKDLVGVSVRRSRTAAAHAHFWTRRTINALPRDVRGPGIVYAHPAFEPPHALFAGERSLVYEGYRLPGDGVHAVGDEMLETRQRNIPRRQLLERYHDLESLMIRWMPGPPEPEATDRAALVGALEDLLAERDLPRQLRLRAQRVVDGGARRAKDVRELATSVREDVGRIEVSTIASFLHPNERGARRIAERIVTAYDRHQRFSVREAVLPMSPPGTSRVRIRRALRRRGLDPARGLRPLAHVAIVQSVAIELRGLKVVQQPPKVPVVLDMTLGPRISLRIGVPTHGVKNLLRAFDTVDTRFAAVGDLTLTRKPGPMPGFDELVLYLNGREHLQATRDVASKADGGLRFSLAL